MITEQQTINPMMPTLRPILLAGACYRRWESRIEFIDDLDDYLFNGIVIALPYLFVMAKVHDLRPLDKAGQPIGDTPDPAWFVRCAIGDLAVLLAHMPFYMPKICFCRRDNPKLRVYRTERLAKLAIRGSKIWAE